MNAYLCSRVDVYAALTTFLAHIGPTMSRSPLSAAIRTFEQPKTFSLALIRCQSVRRSRVIVQLFGFLFFLLHLRYFALHLLHFLGLHLQPTNLSMICRSRRIAKRNSVTAWSSSPQPNILTITMILRSWGAQQVVDIFTLGCSDNWALRISLSKYCYVTLDSDTDTSENTRPCLPACSDSGVTMNALQITGGTGIPSNVTLSGVKIFQTNSRILHCLSYRNV